MCVVVYGGESASPPEKQGELKIRQKSRGPLVGMPTASASRTTVLSGEDNKQLMKEMIPASNSPASRS